MRRHRHTNYEKSHSETIEKTQHKQNKQRVKLHRYLKRDIRNGGTIAYK